MRFRDDNYLTGIYYVTASMGVEKMLSTFKVAPTTGETVTLTFPEGYTVDQIVAKLAEYEVCSADVMYQTMREVDFSSEYSFIQEMDDKEDRFRMLEGYLYPDTYEFYIGENPSSVIRKFLNNFQKKWTEEYAKQAEALNMTVDDVITLASIIQKEAYGEDQSPLVSSVLHNRLDNSGLYPSLQCRFHHRVYQRVYCSIRNGRRRAFTVYRSLQFLPLCGLTCGCDLQPGRRRDQRRAVPGGYKLLLLRARREPQAVSCAQ